MFQNVFEDIYTGDALKNIPWFHILGNHDHKGNHSAQIAYMNKSYRWFINQSFETFILNFLNRILKIKDFARLLLHC